MRRRILVAIVATVALALVLGGTGTYLLLARQASRSTEANLRTEAEGLTGLIQLSRDQKLGRVRQATVVKNLQLEGISVLALGPRGAIRGEPPAGVGSTELPPEALRSGTTLSGRHGDLVWAAASAPTARGGALVVVLTRTADEPEAPIGWFLLGGGLALVVAAGVAFGLSDSLTRPLRRAHGATSRIAEGDLGARLPEPPPGRRDEVADLTRSINTMAAALEDGRARERQFLLSVSHDLRTPLTSIRGYAEAVADGTAPDPRAAAHVIGTEAQRLGRLVGDLLDLARLDARSFAFDARVVPVAEVVEECAEGFRPAAEAAGLALDVPRTDGPTDALVDPDRLGQAVANLVENALKFATSTVTVSVSRSGSGSVRVAVVDDGPGIAADELDHVFDRQYVTSRPPPRGGTGSGLGLAIVRELVGAMGGTVRAESPAAADGRGARLVIDLPAPSATDAPA